jgi:hypothetical protein
MAEIAALLAQANTRMPAARRRLPARTLRQPSADLASANADVQKAGEAVKADDYLTALMQLEGVKDRIEKALAAIEDALAPRRPAGVGEKVRRN